MAFLQQVKSAANNSWHDIFASFGLNVPAPGKHGPCPVCGGHDRFHFDNLNGDGTWHCRKCEDKQSGDGFDLISKSCSWELSKTIKEVASVVGVGSSIGRDVNKSCANKGRPQRSANDDYKLKSRIAAKKKASAIWNGAKVATPSEPYLLKKKVMPFGSKVLLSKVQNGKTEFLPGTLVLPIYDANQELISLEFVCVNKGKQGLFGGQKASGFFPLDGFDAIKAASDIIIAEGFASASTCQSAMAITSVCAFSAGNLLKVAAAIRELNPEANLIIAGDCDSIGFKKASEAALSVCGIAAIPIFPSSDAGNDWNDLFLNSGESEVIKQFNSILDNAIQEKQQTNIIPYKDYKPYESIENQEKTGDTGEGGIPNNEKLNPTIGGYNNLQRPDLSKDSKVAAFIANSLKDDLAVSDEEEELYKWDAKRGFWREFGSANKRLERITYMELKRYYGEDGFSSSKISGVAKSLVFELARIPPPKQSNIIFKNGVLDPVTGTFIECSVKELYARYSTGVDYQITDGSLEQCPNFKNFLNFISGMDEEESSSTRASARLDVLLSCMIMVLLRKYDWQLFVEVVGKGGTGKSTLAALINLLVGEASVQTIEAKDLETPEGRASIANAALLYLPDMKQYQGDGAGLKKITGGDPVSCRRLYGSPFKAYIRAIVLAVNNDPMKFTDRGGAIARRRVIVKLDRKVPAKAREKNLAQKLKSEVPAIIQFLLSWMELKGGESSVYNILVDAINSEDAKEVLTDSDPITGFASDLYYHESAKCIVGGKPSTLHADKPREKLFHAYLQYCDYHNHDPKMRLTQKTFSSCFEEAAQRFGNVRKGKAEGRSVFYGVAVTGGPSHQLPEWLLSSGGYIPT